jgi:hypothetical protein
MSFATFRSTFGTRLKRAMDGGRLSASATGISVTVLP